MSWNSKKNIGISILLYIYIFILRISTRCKLTQSTYRFIINDDKLYVIYKYNLLTIKVESYFPMSIFWMYNAINFLLEALL